MQIRPANELDVPTIAAIGLRAFANEPIYDHFFPRRSQYPEDYARSFRDEAHRFLVTPGHVIMVAEIDDAEISSPSPSQQGKGGKVVVGYATFIRHGSSEELLSWNPDSAAKALRRILFRLRMFVISMLWPNRAMSPRVIRDYYEQATKLHMPHLTASQSRIDFRSLAVDPAYQNRGYGERLVEWCGVAAWQEDVPVFGDATTKGLPLYLRNGCEDIGKVHLPAQTVDVGRRDSLRLDALDVVVLRWRA